MILVNLLLYKMNVCIYQVVKIQQRWTKHNENWYVFVLLHREDLYAIGSSHQANLIISPKIL